MWKKEQTARAWRSESGARIFAGRARRDSIATYLPSKSFGPKEDKRREWVKNRMDILPQWHRASPCFCKISESVNWIVYWPAINLKGARAIFPSKPYRFFCVLIAPRCVGRRAVFIQLRYIHACGIIDQIETRWQRQPSQRHRLNVQWHRKEREMYCPIPIRM